MAWGTGAPLPREQLSIHGKQIHYLLRRPFIFEVVLVIIASIKSKSKEKYVLYIPFRKNL
jgi:hypothetical protein